MKTILWPTDLSSHSKKALADVATLSEQMGARVVVLYASVDLCSYFPAYGNYPSSDMLGEFRSWEAEHARKQLNELCETELNSCPEIAIRIMQGDPADAILELAQKEHADLIVMSSHGLGLEKRGGASRNLGSVAERVTREAPVTVHLVRA